MPIFHHFSCCIHESMDRLYRVRVCVCVCVCLFVCMYLSLFGSVGHFAVGVEGVVLRIC